MIRMAKIDELNTLDSIACKVINDMINCGIPQWNFDYPRKEHYLSDITENCLYVCGEDQVLGAICLKPQDDPPYNELDNWTHKESLVVHRVIVDPDSSRSGVAYEMFQFAETVAKDLGFKSIKVDTHKENYKMNGFLKKLGYIEKGYLTSIDRIAFEKII